MRPRKHVPQVRCGASLIIKTGDRATAMGRHERQLPISSMKTCVRLHAPPKAATLVDTMRPRKHVPQVRWGASGGGSVWLSVIGVARARVPHPVEERVLLVVQLVEVEGYVDCVILRRPAWGRPSIAIGSGAGGRRLRRLL